MLYHSRYFHKSSLSNFMFYNFFWNEIPQICKSGNLSVLFFVSSRLFCPTFLLSYRYSGKYLSITLKEGHRVSSPLRTVPVRPPDLHAPLVELTMLCLVLTRTRRPRWKRSTHIITFPWYSPRYSTSHLVFTLFIKSTLLTVQLMK